MTDTTTSEHPDPFSLARPDGDATCVPIAELTCRLVETTDANRCADEKAIAAYHAGDIAQDEIHGAEMRRLDKIEWKLRRKICRGRPTSPAEALMQLVVAIDLLDLPGKKTAFAAETGVRSALRFFVPLLDAKLPDQLTHWALRDPAARPALDAKAAQ